MDPESTVLRGHSQTTPPPPCLLHGLAGQVPVPIIDRIAGLRHGGMKKRLVARARPSTVRLVFSDGKRGVGRALPPTLLRYKLVAHENRQVWWPTGNGFLLVSSDFPRSIYMVLLLTICAWRQLIGQYFTSQARGSFPLFGT